MLRKHYRIVQAISMETTLRSIGKPIGDFQVKAVDDEGVEVPVDATGELYFKGDAVVPSYFSGDDETANAFQDGCWNRRA